MHGNPANSSSLGLVAATSSPNHQEGMPEQTEIEVVVCRIVGGEPALVAQLACALVKSRQS
jgi:hypothetical protein